MHTHTCTVMACTYHQLLLQELEKALQSQSQSLLDCLRCRLR